MPEADSCVATWTKDAISGLSLATSTNNWPNHVVIGNI